MHLCWSIVAAWFQRPFRDTNFTWNDWQRLVGPCGSEGPQVALCCFHSITDLSTGRLKGRLILYQELVPNLRCCASQLWLCPGHRRWWTLWVMWQALRWTTVRLCIRSFHHPALISRTCVRRSARVIWSWGARFFTWMMGTAWCRHTGSSGGRSQTLPWWMIRKCTSLESLAQPTSGRLISKHKQCRHLTSSHFSHFNHFSHFSLYPMSILAMASSRLRKLRLAKAKNGPLWCCAICPTTTRGDVLEDVGWPWADGQIWLCILALWFLPRCKFGLCFREPGGRQGCWWIVEDFPWLFRLGIAYC